MTDEEKYVQGSLFDGEDGFLYDTVYESEKGYILDISKAPEDTEYTYTVTAPNGDFIEDYKSKDNALDMKRSEFFKSEIFNKFRKILSKVQNKSSYKVLDKYKKETPYDVGYGRSNYSWTPSYKLNTEEALKKYCKSNTLCFHKTDPTTTMLEQIYHGKGWDVVNEAYEMSPETISELIDKHERIVMLGHGSSGGLIGFIGPDQASHLESKKLFALWCNADAYCDHYLPNKKGFFACGNMPSDDNEARWVGYHVTHKYMDDNITYWCKLCGDVVDQCLDGNADAGCKYIRDKYWERYHKGTADEVGITKYNYVRTKVAGQNNLPEPTGEEIEEPKETEEERWKKEHPNQGYNNWGNYSYSNYTSRKVEPVRGNYEKDNSFKNGETLFTTSNGSFCIGYKVTDDQDSDWDCKLYDKSGKALGTKLFAYISKNGQNVYDVFLTYLGRDKLGDIIIDAEISPVKDNKDKEVFAKTDKGYTIIEEKSSGGYKYSLMKDGHFIHSGFNPTKLKPEEAWSDFNAMLDIGNLIE